MAKEFACALTHVRHESFFLEKWIRHYGAIVGHDNLYVVIDGDDWEPDVDLTGVHTEILLDAPRRRIKNDRFMAKAMSQHANKLRKRYQYVIRGDCDEYVVIDPEAGLDWPTALEELGEVGYVFALGIDVVQDRSERVPVDRDAPLLGQRQFGYVADRYTKPFVISRWNNWAGGAHRLLNRPVRMSEHFVLFHMALADQTIAQDRFEARGSATAQHRSFVGHQTDRLNVIAGGDLGACMDFVEARAIAFAQFPYEPDGEPAKRPRASNDPRAGEQGLPVRIPERFAGLV
ncbi:MAG: glycosyltransferase family 2 protein [Roseicyclus sp.]